ARGGRYRVSLVMIPRLPVSTLFPYTTLFRSQPRRRPADDPPQRRSPGARPIPLARRQPSRVVGRSGVLAARQNRAAVQRTTPCRSDEHTSELQSRGNLVCRLLLEKKNNPRQP